MSAKKFDEELQVPRKQEDFRRLCMEAVLISPVCIPRSSRPPPDANAGFRFLAQEQLHCVDLLQGAVPRRGFPRHVTTT